MSSGSANTAAPDGRLGQVSTADLGAPNGDVSDTDIDLNNTTSTQQLSDKAEADSGNYNGNRSMDGSEEDDDRSLTCGQKAYKKARVETDKEGNSVYVITDPSDNSELFIGSIEELRIAVAEGELLMDDMSMSMDTFRGLPGSPS